MYLIPLISSITGALVTGYFMLKVMKNEFKNQKNLLHEEDMKLRKTILQSIHDEIESIYDRYINSIGNKIASLEDNEFLNQYYPISDDFFMFYRANTFAISKLDDHELRKSIIYTYILAKSLIESLKINNNFLRQYEKHYQMFLENQKMLTEKYLESRNLNNIQENLNSIPQQEVYEINLELSKKQLKSYAKSLQKIHFEFEGEVKQLLRKLHKIGVLHEK